MTGQLFDPGPETVREIPVTDDRLYDAVTDYLAARGGRDAAATQRPAARRVGNTARATRSASQAFGRLVDVWQTVTAERALRDS